LSFGQGVPRASLRGIFCPFYRLPYTYVSLSLQCITSFSILYYLKVLNFDTFIQQKGTWTIMLYKIKNYTQDLQKRGILTFALREIREKFPSFSEIAIKSVLRRISGNNTYPLEKDFR